MRNVMGRLGRMALLAIAAPAMAAEAVRDALRSGGARWLPALRLKGDRDEARRMLREVDARRAQSAARIAELTGHVARLTDDLRGARRQRDALFADALASRKERSAEKMERRAAELQRDTERALRIEQSRELHAAIYKVCEERDAARAELAALKRKAETRGEASCAWCLARVSYVSAIGLCGACTELGATSIQAIRDRVALRAESCPARRTSPNPLDVRCALGCGSPAGHPCCDDCPEVTS